MFYLSLESSSLNPKATASLLSVQKHVPTTIMYRLFISDSRIARSFLEGRGGGGLRIRHSSLFVSAG